MAVNRKDFLRNVAGVASAAALVSGVDGTEEAKAQRLSAPGASQIEHIVVVMMENRSLDHLLGWLPGVMAIRRG